MFDTVIDYIARTNLFNFIIFAGIIIYVFIKLDVLGNLNKAAEVISENIENSTTAKNESEEKLKTIENKLANLANEVNDIIEQSEINAKLVGEKVITDANLTVENIKHNAEKLVENKTALLKNDIMKRTSLASVEIAKEHIIKELNNNSWLHDKLIDESIESINGAEI